MKEVIGIIGYGRFGAILESLLKQDFSLKIYDPNASRFDNVLDTSAIFVAVPIRHFETVIREIAPKIAPHTTIIDVCSVKIYPVNIMKQYLLPSVGIIATHPLFGPDSIKNGYPSKMVMYPVRHNGEQYHAWKTFFSKKKIHVLEMAPEEHDQLAAKSQGITHFIGRALEKMGAVPTPIDTAGYATLLKTMEQTCHDSRELFLDLQRFNPYTKKAIEALEMAILAVKTECHL